MISSTASTRDKPDAAYCDVILKGLRKAGADAFIYIGGNDTSGTQQILTDAAGGRMAFVHAPKTIDNDLEENDHVPGFISAAEFVAGCMRPAPDGPGMSAEQAGQLWAQIVPFAGYGFNQGHATAYADVYRRLRGMGAA